MATKSAMAREAESLGVAVDTGIDPSEGAAAATATRGPKPARQAQAPPPAPVEMPDEGDDLVPVRDAETELLLPRIAGGRVIYIGPSKRKSVPLKGSMIVEQWELEPEERDAKGVVVKPAKYEREETPNIEHGFYSYDFSTHDSRGKMILEGHRLVQPNDRSAQRDQRLRYKAQSRVEHPEHLRVFHRMRDANSDPEFVVEVPRREQARFQRWVQEREAMLGRQRALIEYTAKEA